MSDKNRNLYYLHELTDYKVADEYSDIRGWQIEDSDGRNIGKVENLLVDKKNKRVVYLDVEVNNSVIEEGYKNFEVPASHGVHGFLNKEGDNHIIVPIAMVSLDADSRRVKTDQIDRQTFRSTRRFSKGTIIDSQFELAVLHGYFPYEKVYQQSENDRPDNYKNINNSQEDELI